MASQIEQKDGKHVDTWRMDHVFDSTLISSLDSYLQLVAADVVDDEDVEPDREEYDADDADDLEGLVEEVHGEVLRCGDGPVALRRLRPIARIRGGGGGHLSTNWLRAPACCHVELSFATHS